MADKYLNTTGLTKLWAKIKSLIGLGAGLTKDKSNNIAVDEDWFKEEVAPTRHNLLSVPDVGVAVSIPTDTFLQYPYVIITDMASGDYYIGYCDSDNRSLEDNTIDYKDSNGNIILTAEGMFDEAFATVKNIALNGEGRIEGCESNPEITGPRVQCWLNLSDYVKQEALQKGLATKQDKLISGTNVKTINGEAVLGSGDIDTTPTLDKVLKKDNTSEEVAKVGGVEVVHEDSGNSSELYAAGLNLEYNYEGQENRRMAHIDYESVGFSHLEKNTSPSGGYNIVPDFVVSARNGQVEMNEAIKGAFKEKLGITNEVFIAKQGTTSAAEIIAAYEANKMILIVPSGTLYTSWRWVSIGLDRKSATKCEVIAIFNNGSNLNSGLTLVKFTVDETTWTYASQVVQNKLVSGENIKTINGNSLLGAGNIEVSSGGGADFSIDEAANTGILGKGNDYFGVDMSNDNSMLLSLTKPGEYAKNKVIPTKKYVDGLKGIFVLDTTNPCSYNDLQAAINTPMAVFIKHEGVFYPLVEKWENDEGAKRYVNIASIQRQGVDKGVTYFFFEALIADLDSPIAYSSTFVQPTGKPYTDSIVGELRYLATTDKTNLVAALNEVNGKVGMNLEIGVEKWYGTYTEAGVTYQVYTKAIKIDALPETAGITNYPHGITGIKQILSAYGFGTNGFVLNAPRQNAQDNISIYQVQKGGNIAIEVGKNRSNMGAYIVLIYAKNN